MAYPIDFLALLTYDFFTGVVETILQMMKNGYPPTIAALLENLLKEGASPRQVKYHEKKLEDLLTCLTQSTLSKTKTGKFSIVIFLEGLPGCGKSTFVAILKQVFPDLLHINQDALKAKAQATKQKCQDYQDILKAALKSGVRLIVIDRTNGAFTERHKNLLLCAGHLSMCVSFQDTMEDCITQATKRSEGVLVEGLDVVPSSLEKENITKALKILNGIRCPVFVEEGFEKVFHLPRQQEKESRDVVMRQIIDFLHSLL